MRTTGPLLLLLPPRRREVAVLVGLLLAAAALGGAPTHEPTPAPAPAAPTPGEAVAPQPTASAALVGWDGVVGPADLPAGCDAPNRHLSLWAVELDRVDGRPRLGWGLTPESASIPGPTIEMVEGECLAVTVTNDVSPEVLAELRDDPTVGMLHQDPDDPLPLGVSLHVHGVKYTSTSDGTMHTGSWVPPGRSRTYVWYAEPRRVADDGRVLSHGTAGYWWFHDHVVGTDHGTGGVASGLFGALVVRRPGDPLPDRTFALAFGNDATINLRRYPDTDTCDPHAPLPSDTCLVAVRGERVELVIFGIGDDFHTFHLHGHTWVDNRTGVLAPTDDVTQLVDVITTGPSQSFGFQVVAGASVGSGDWMIHCHVQRHSDLGMSTFLHVVEPGEGAPPAPGSVDTRRRPAPPAELLAAGARFRGSATPRPVGERPLRSEQPDLGFWCSLPLSEWARVRG